MNVNLSKLAELESYLCEMNRRGLSSWYNTSYQAPVRALETDVMYFQPLMAAPSDRRQVAIHIIGSDKPRLKDSVYNKICNIFVTFFFGPSDIYHTLSGKYDPADAFIDFERVTNDPAYVNEIAANIAFARKIGLKLWTTTELHTSLQTEARNFCRIKHNDPARKPHSTDLVEWIASWIKAGYIDKMLNAKSLSEAYSRITDIRGVGPYYAGNPVMMLAALQEASYNHEEPFCAPGAGAINTLNWLFDGKVKPLNAIIRLWENQEALMPNLSIPNEFQNIDVSYGKIWNTPQLRYTANAFEVGCCQFSVYRKFLEQPDAIKRRLDVKVDLTPFKLREQGVSDDDIIDATSEGKKLRNDLLEF